MITTLGQPGRLIGHLYGDDVQFASGENLRGHSRTGWARNLPDLRRVALDAAGRTAHLEADVVKFKPRAGGHAVGGREIPRKGQRVLIDPRESADLQCHRLDALEALRGGKFLNRAHDIHRKRKFVHGMNYGNVL
jgi:hypothetical protein